MFNLRDISIRNKLILMQVFTSLLVLGIFFAVFIITDIRGYKQRKVDAMIGLAQVLGTNSISTLQFQDNEAASEILSELQNVAPEIVHATILDKKGKLFASYTRLGSSTFKVPDGLDQKKFMFSGRQLFISNDIQNENETMGKVVLEVELSELEQIRQSKYQLAALLLLFAIVVSFLIAVFVQRYISRRLIYLVDAVKKVSKSGDYSITLTDSGQDEISTLIRAFDNLLKQVKETQQRKDEFISVASHELKTPLTSIKGYLDLLNVVEEKQPNKQFVQKALGNVGKLERLIKDLLDVSKIQSGQLELTMKEFSIDHLIDETITAIQIVSGTHEIVRDYGFQDVMVTGDRLRIEQVLTNLLSNAIKYSPGERKVIVGGNKNGSEVIISIRDFGIGVPNGEQLNIFERFYRNKDISITITGFGLGLYICRDIIKRHHGRIWVEPESKGSSFYFSLPLENNGTTPISK